MTGIKAERLDDLSLLEPAWIEWRGYRICIPTPASYIVQKLYINPVRRPERKRAQDIRKIDILVRAMMQIPGQMEQLAELVEKLPADKAKQVRETAKANGIALCR